MKKTMILTLILIVAFVFGGCGDKSPVTDINSNSYTDENSKGQVKKVNQEKKEEEQSNQSEPETDPGLEASEITQGDNSLKRHTWIDEIADCFNQKALRDNGIPLTIPVYDEAMVLYMGEPANYGYVRLGWDMSVFNMSDSYLTFTNFYKYFPDCAIREREDGSYYVALQTQGGKRMFVFYDESNRLITPIGYAVVTDENAKRKSDFDNITIGSTMSEVETVDDLTSVYRHVFIDMYRYTPENIKWCAENDGWACCSVHYLLDGILIFTYGEMNESGDLVVTDIRYSENYSLTDCMGRSINYRINPTDLP